LPSLLPVRELVRFEIEEQDQDSYGRAAEFPKLSKVNIPWLQHTGYASQPDGCRDWHATGGLGGPVIQIRQFA